MVETNPTPRGGGAGESISLLSEINGTDREGAYDFLRSVCPEKPVYDTEFHYDFWPWLPQQYFEYETWKSCLHGCDGLLIWVWHDERLGYLTREPQKMDGFGKAALDVQRLAKLVHGFLHSSAEVAIPLSEPTFKSRTKRFFWFMLRDIQAAMDGADAHYDIITDRLIDDNFARICKFLARGGSLVLIWDSCGAKDAYGRPRRLDALRRNEDRVFRLDVEDVRPASDWRWNKRCSADVVKALSLELDEIYQKAGITREMVTRSAARQPAPEVEMRTITTQGRRYAYLINHSDEQARTVMLMGSGGPLRPHAELIDDEPITGTQLGLGPLEVALYDLGPSDQKIEDNERRGASRMLLNR